MIRLSGHCPVLPGEPATAEGIAIAPPPATTTAGAAPRAGAFTRIIALSFTTFVLMVGAVFFPFLEISRMGFGNATSLFGVAMAFSDGALLPPHTGPCTQYV